MITYVSDLVSEKFEIKVRGNVEDLHNYLALYSVDILECIHAKYTEFVTNGNFDPNIPWPFPKDTIFEIGKTYSTYGVSASFGMGDDCLIVYVTFVKVIPDEEETRKTLIDPEAGNADLIDFR
jgi:hypothetical protein